MKTINENLKLRHILSLWCSMALLSCAANARHSQEPGSNDTLRLGNRRVVIERLCGASALPGVSLVHVHEDEHTAVTAMQQYFADSGSGCLATLRHGQGRMIGFRMGRDSFRFDPNRIFTAKGLEATMRRHGAYNARAARLVDSLARRLTRQYVDGYRLIVALHNNSDGGGLTIHSYRPGGNFAQDALEAYVNPEHDEDDFFYTTTRQAYEFFRDKGFNVMLQHPDTVTDDGSLSVYAGMRGIDYVNIETQIGQKDRQLKMIAAVLEYIDRYYR